MQTGPSATASTTSAIPPRVLSITAASRAPSHLVVLLHGVGASADGFHELARRLALALPGVDLLTPDGLHPFDQARQGRQWFSIAGVTEDNRPARVRVAAAEIDAWIDRELERRSLARDRLVLVGFSQGAIVASWLSVHRSPPPAAVVMLSGRVADDAPPVPGSVETPVLVLHGEADRVMPIAVVAPGAQRLEAWGARVTTRTYAGLGHEVSPAELDDVAAFLRSTLGSSAGSNVAR